MVVFDIDAWLDGDLHLEGIRQLSVHAPVVAVSASSDAHVILRCLRAGARGFAQKGGHLLEAVREVAQGRTVVPLLDGDAAHPVPPRQPDEAPVLSSLTRRQLEVLRLLMHGRTNKAIAMELGISEATVKSHVSVVLQVLGARNRTEAVFAISELKLPWPGLGGEGRP